jgi:uncharacterized protein (TIGR03067 family)
MRVRLPQTFAVLAALTAGFAPVPKPKDKNGPALKVLQGSWEVIRVERGGPKGNVSVSNSLSQKMKIDGDRVTRTAKFRDKEMKSPDGVLVLDAHKSPAWFEIRNAVPKGSVMRGVFKVEGDTLLWAYNARNFRDRPAKVEGDLRPTELRMTFKRVKPKPDKKR